jgi:hypothetical protein
LTACYWDGIGNALTRETRRKSDDRERGKAVGFPAGNSRRRQRSDIMAKPPKLTFDRCGRIFVGYSFITARGGARSALRNGGSSSYPGVMLRRCVRTHDSRCIKLDAWEDVSGCVYSSITYERQPICLCGGLYSPGSRSTRASHNTGRPRGECNRPFLPYSQRWVS